MNIALLRTLGVLSGNGGKELMMRSSLVLYFLSVWGRKSG